jgi:hypothetical protein
MEFISQNTARVCRPARSNYPLRNPPVIQIRPTSHPPVLQEVFTRDQSIYRGSLQHNKSFQRSEPFDRGNIVHTFYIYTKSDYQGTIKTQTPKTRVG